VDVPPYLPNVLVIGAMKSGTTSLCQDLGLHPDIFLPEDKEPNYLSSKFVSIETAEAMYCSLYAPGQEHRLRVDGSTSYSKYPLEGDVSARAKAVLGTDIRSLYIVRHPVNRIESHIRHDLVMGRLRSGDEALRTPDDYVTVSSYGRQLKRWIDAFGRDRCLAVPFECYRDRRADVLRTIAGFLHIDRDLFRREQPHANRSDELYLPRGVFRRLQRSRVYRDRIRPLTTQRLRFVLRRTVAPRPREEWTAFSLSAAARSQLVTALREDQRLFHSLTGWSHLS
jgi:hypothetical protein